MAGSTVGTWASQLSAATPLLAGKPPRDLSTTIVTIKFKYKTDVKLFKNVGNLWIISVPC
jgi:hypothetical protein